MARSTQASPLSPHQQQWCAQRRDLLANAGLLVAGTLGFAQASVAAPAVNPPRATRPWTAAEAALIARLCELVIPRTDTPGALEVGVPAFVHEVAMRWLTDREFTVFTDGLHGLDTQARKRHAQAFVECTQEQQVALLAQSQSAAHDYHRAHPEKVTSDSLIGKVPLDENTPFFTRLRELITIGYQTSEAVVRTRMVYLPIPNRYAGEASITVSGGKQYAW